VIALVFALFVETSQIRDLEADSTTAASPTSSSSLSASIVLLFSGWPQLLARDLLSSIVEQICDCDSLHWRDLLGAPNLRFYGLMNASAGARISGAKWPITVSV
jgi:hypothetical protein